MSYSMINCSCAEISSVLTHYHLCLCSTKTSTFQLNFEIDDDLLMHFSILTSQHNIMVNVMLY